MSKQNEQNNIEEYSSVTSLSNIEQINEIEKILISPHTQSAIDCEIGEIITPDRPWVFIEKSKIIDDLISFKRKSEFISLEKRIKMYPENEILIGAKNFIPNQKAEFYICMTVEAKTKIQQLLKKEHENILAQILACINRKAKPWVSLGSEEEVTGNMNFNNRCLFIVEVQSNFSHFNQRVKFKSRTPKEYKNAYAEMHPGRFPFNLIMKKCVDHSTQSTGCKCDKKVQFLLRALTNKSTQYAFEFPEISSPSTFEKIKKFFATAYETLSKELICNIYMNIYSDDYNNLVRNKICNHKLIPTEISSYQDITNCKNKKVSSISWSSFVSGVVAAAYVMQPSFCIVSKDISVESISNDCTTDFYLVLIWTYKNTLHPTLYLHAIREVTTLSFCPYNKHILVGGCSNGQILVWEISNKVLWNIKKSSCSRKPYQMYIILEKLTNWFKKPPGENYIFPTIISALNTGHLTPISSIAWIPPSHYISRQGKYEDSMNNQKHMQFFASSLSGSKIIVYDLIVDDSIKTQHKFKATRLSKLPTGLRPAETILTEMRQNFHPKFILNTTDKINCLPYHPIIKLITNNERYKYTCYNPDTLEDSSKVSYFKMVDLLDPFDRTQTIMCSTGNGTLQIVSWDGHNYDQGYTVNTEKCKVHLLKVIHDGPILICEANPFIPNILLTIGGTILAIWNISKSQSPLLWRKGKCRYCSGMWSNIHPLAFMMIRNDSYYEYWNLSVKTNDPITSFKSKGSKIIKLFSDSSMSHVRKKTFISTDEVGAFKVFNVSSWEKYEIETTDRIESVKFLNSILEVKRYTEKLKIKCAKKMEKKPEKVEETVDVILPTTLHEDEKFIEKQTKTVYAEKVKQWQLKEEMSMRKILLEKKNIHIDDIEKQMKPLIKKEKNKKRNVQKTQSMNEAPVKKILKSITAALLKMHKRTAFCPSGEARVNMKKSYKESYDKLEKDVMKRINARPYKLDFDWNLFVNRSKIEIDLD